MIGLCDFDLYCLSNEKKLYVPNVEIMKLATFFTSVQRKTCCLIDPFSDEDILKYEKVYFVSEKRVKEIPYKFKNANNIYFCGSAFTNGTYIGFENEQIDLCRPDVSIYKDFLIKNFNNYDFKIINNFLDAYYYRAYVNGNFISFPEKLTARQRVYIFDNNLSQEQGKRIYETLRGGIKIFLNPIIISDSSYLPFFKSNDVIYNEKIPLKNFYLFFKTHGENFRRTQHDIFLSLNETFDSQIQYNNNLFYTLNLLYKFWSKNVEVRIYYDEKKKVKYDELYKAIAIYSKLVYNRQTLKGTSLISFLSRKEHEAARAEYQQLIQSYPQKRELFLQTFYELKKKEYW